MISTNKRANESFVVAKIGQTAIPSSGTLNNTTTLNVNLNDGQLGFVSDSSFGTVAANAFTDATPTITEAPVIKIYQGNANSGSVVTATAPYPLSVQTYASTMAIDGRGPVYVTKQAYQLPTHSTWVLGHVHGNAGAVNVLSETEYTLRIAMRGHRIEEQFSEQQAASLQATIVTPNFTTLGLTTQQSRSWILHNMAWNINRNSKALNISGNRFTTKAPVLALLISTAGGAGVAIGGGAPISAGTVVPVINTVSGIRSITLTESQAESIKAAAVAGQGAAIASVTWTITTIDLATATVVSPAISDRLMIIGLDETPAFVDYVPQVKVRLQVGLGAGFDVNTVLDVEYVKATEGQGLSRQLDLLYKATQGQRLYSLNHTEDPVINYPSPIVSGVVYTVYNVYHTNLEQIDTFNLSASPLREIVCIPTFSSGTTPNPLISTFDTVFNSWLGSSKNNNAIVSL